MFAGEDTTGRAEKLARVVLMALDHKWPSGGQDPAVLCSSCHPSGAMILPEGMERSWFFTATERVLQRESCGRKAVLSLCHVVFTLSGNECGLELSSFSASYDQAHRAGNLL